MREQLLVYRTATKDELEAYWPGGEENPGKDLWAWILCHANLCRFLGRKDDQAKTSDLTRRRQLAQEAIAELPETVQLTARDAEDRPKTVTVYPKGDVALREIHARNMVLGSLIDDAEILQHHGGQNDVELLVRCLQEQSYLQRVIVWIATHPGPRLPFAEGETSPTPPDWLQDLSTIDFYLIAPAVQRVNVLRLSGLEQSQTSKKRPDWSVFWSLQESERGISAAQLQRDHSLAAVLASAAERGRAHAEAAEQAKKQQPRVKQRRSA